MVMYNFVKRVRVALTPTPPYPGSDAYAFRYIELT